jgi:HEAT repeat protein
MILPSETPFQDENEALQTLSDRNNSVERRLFAIRALLSSFHESMYPVFSTLLYNEAEDIQIRAALALSLGKLATETAITILMPLAHHENSLLRQYSLEALGSTHHESVIPILIQGLEDPDNHVFAAASEALGYMGKTAYPALIALLSSAREDVRSIAAWQLGEHEAQEAITALLDRIKTETETIEVKALCVWAIGQIGLGTPEVLRVLSMAKFHPAPEIRLRAETALTKTVRHSN